MDSERRSPPTEPLFRLDDVSFRYEAARAHALEELTLELEAGELHAILGPNGSGKSTLLRVMLGELVPSVGRVDFAGRPVTSWRRREIARRVAFVPQAEPLAFPMSVRTLVEMGRYPHVGVLGRATSADHEAVESAMERAGVIDLADRSITTLSGGERQRARIARALAQEPSTLVLDEPTAALDLHFEMETFELMRDLARDSGFTVVVATHNLNLAARFSSHLVLLGRGRIEAVGAPTEVFVDDTLERVFQWPVVVMPHPGPGPDTGAPQVLPLSRDG
jgi:ABC-type cobalamin/Fe3+-siderophores transport system ATPase subunit